MSKRKKKEEEEEEEKVEKRKKEEEEEEEDNDGVGRQTDGQLSACQGCCHIAKATKDREKAANCRSGREVSGEIKPCPHLILAFSLRTVRNAFLCLIPPPGWWYFPAVA